MHINPFVIAVVVAIAAAFVYIIFKQNQKDKKKLEETLNDDYVKPKDEGPKT